MGEAHDAHGIQSLLEIIFVLLARDGNVTIRQETVVAKAFEQQVRWRRKGKKEKFILEYFNANFNQPSLKARVLRCMFFPVNVQCCMLGYFVC